jgi:hypothetical protein
MKDELERIWKEIAWPLQMHTSECLDKYKWSTLWIDDYMTQHKMWLVVSRFER